MSSVEQSSTSGSSITLEAVCNSAASYVSKGEGTLVSSVATSVELTSSSTSTTSKPVTTSSVTSSVSDIKNMQHAIMSSGSTTYMAPKIINTVHKMNGPLSSSDRTKSIVRMYPATDVGASHGSIEQTNGATSSDTNSPLSSSTNVASSAQGANHQSNNVHITKANNGGSASSANIDENNVLNDVVTDKTDVKQGMITVGYTLNHDNHTNPYYLASLQKRDIPKLSKSPLLDKMNSLPDDIGHHNVFTKKNLVITDHKSLDKLHKKNNYFNKKCNIDLLSRNGTSKELINISHSQASSSALSDWRDVLSDRRITTKFQSSPESSKPSCSQVDTTSTSTVTDLGQTALLSSRDGTDSQDSKQCKGNFI